MELPLETKVVTRKPGILEVPISLLETIRIIDTPSTQQASQFTTKPGMSSLRGTISKPRWSDLEEKLPDILARSKLYKVRWQDLTTTRFIITEGRGEWQ